MEKMDEILRNWRQLEPQMMLAESIRTDPALQPRDEKLVRMQDRYRLEEASQEHVGRMHAALEAGRDQQLEPLLVASCGEGLYLVDGHHRLKAYLRAGRPVVPVRVLDTSKQQAVILSKLVNVGDVKLAMDKEQARDACWQYIAFLTNRGKREAGVSDRRLAGKFGIARGTVQAMLKHVQDLTLEEFAPAALDPGTGWPRWKAVKGNAWKGGMEAMTPDQQLRWKAEKFAKRLSKLIDSVDERVRSLGLRMLSEGSEACSREDALSDIRKWSELHESVTF